MHHGKRCADLDDLGLAEVRSEYLALRRRRCAALVQVRIGKDQCRLVSVRQPTAFPRVTDLLDEILGKTLLPRDREANLLSKAAIGDRGVSKPGDLLRRLLDDAVAPQVSVERAVGSRGEVLGHRIDGGAAGIPKAGGG